MKHQAAAGFACAGFTLALHREPTRAARQVLQGIAWLESRYGEGWSGAGKGSFNMGAIQYGRTPCDPAKSFEYTDTRPTDTGGSIPYRICFRKYSSPVAGFEDLARVAYAKRPLVLAAAYAGNLWGVSKELRATKYYEGFGRTQEERIANHHKALLSAVTAIARALNEPMPDGSEPPLRTLSKSAVGEDVKRVQRALHVTADGIFGRETERAVKNLQASRTGFRVDGKVGSQTWAAIEDIENRLTVRDH